MMRLNPNHNPMFFQPLLPNFLSNFSIPQSFHKYLRGVDQDGEDEVAILMDKTRKREWYVKVDGERQHFKEGWGKFCKDCCLQIGDFLMFRLEGQLVFDILIFAPNGCERDFPVIVNHPSSKIQGMEKKRDYQDDHPKDKVSFKPSSYPYQRIVIQPFFSRWGRMVIPKDFAAENGLAKRWCEMELIDQNGRSWIMPLRYSRSTISGQSAYIGDWRRFHSGSGLSNGDHVVMEVIDNGEKPVVKFYITEKCSSSSVPKRSYPSRRSKAVTESDSSSEVYSRKKKTRRNE